MQILIVEDEPVHARYLTSKLMEILGEKTANIVHKKSIGESLEFLKVNSIDLFFLDLNLYGDNGFEILKQMPTSSIFTIIVSANTNYALEAFEYGVLDFIPKPVESERLEQSLKRYFIFQREYGNINAPISGTKNGGTEKKYSKTRLQNVNLDELHRELKKLMETHKIYQDEDLSLEILAEKLGVHSRQLSEFLNGRLHTTYIMFIQKYRIAEAKRLLLESREMNIADIGFAVGYKSLSSFYEAFKAETGMKAGEFRERNAID